jgi:hypothetical protein
MKKRKNQRRRRLPLNLMMKIKLIQKRLQERRRKKLGRQRLRLKKMVALRRPTRSIMTRHLRKDKPSLEESPLLRRPKSIQAR